MKRRPFVLAILDGWGFTTSAHGNAIAAADLPNWQRIMATYPNTLLDASGEAVGLPKGVMGNSEVGHINIGSGRVVPQGIVVIDDEIASGTFGQNKTLRAAVEHVRRTGGTLRLMGLVSDGKVHSSLDHVEALIDVASEARVPLLVDAFLDGRDVPPSSAGTYLARLESHLAARGYTDAIATVSGRFYAMDRDKRWERVRKAYDALANGQAEHHAATRAGRAARSVRARRDATSSSCRRSSARRARCATATPASSSTSAPTARASSPWPSAIPRSRSFRSGTTPSCCSPP